MSDLLYHPTWSAARERLTTWWQGGDLGRPAMQITVPRAEPWEDIEVLPEPEGWVTHYSTRSLEYRVNLARRNCLYTTYLAEAVPYAAPGDLGPGERGGLRPGRCGRPRLAVPGLPGSRDAGDHLV